MTMTPNSPSELVQLNQNQVFGEGLTPQEVVEKLCHHSEFQPTALIQLMKGLTLKIYNFHRNVTNKMVEDGEMDSEHLFWVEDTQKLHTILTLMKNL